VKNDCTPSSLFALSLSSSLADIAKAEPVGTEQLRRKFLPRSSDEFSSASASFLLSWTGSGEADVVVLRDESSNRVTALHRI
jgi:hypothetical protein